MSRLPAAAGAALAAAAIAAAAGPARVKGSRRVHAVRVASKRLRSFWRLLAPAMGGRASRRRRRELSRAAHFLAAPRERDVLASLARELRRSERRLSAPLAAFLRRLPPSPPPASIRRRLGLAAPALAASARALAGEALAARRAELREGLKSQERRLSRARRRAGRGRAADLHACRKRAKDLQYILEAFGTARRFARRCRKAAKKLGRARDLRTLAERAGLRDEKLEEKARALDAAALSRL